MDDGFITATPPCQRAVREAIKILKAAGHHVEEFDLATLNATEGSDADVSVPTAIHTYFNLISSGTALIMEALEGEPLMPFLKKLVAVHDLKNDNLLVNSHDSLLKMMIFY